MNRKAKGDSAYLSAIIVTAAFMAMMVLFTYFSGALSHNTNINSIGRKYLMKMETNGYLTADDEAELVRELEELSYVQSVSMCSDTSYTYVGHNHELILHFSVKLTDIPFSNFGDIFSPGRDDNATRTFVVNIKSSYI